MADRMTGAARAFLGQGLGMGWGDGDDDGPRIIVTTRDEGLYGLALDVEGTGRRCDVTWHPSKRPDGSCEMTPFGMPCSRMSAVSARVSTPSMPTTPLRSR